MFCHIWNHIFFTWKTSGSKVNFELQRIRCELCGYAQLLTKLKSWNTFVIVFGCFRLFNAVFIDGKIFALLGLNIDVKGVFISLWQDFLLERKTSVVMLPFLVPASVICMELCWLLKANFKSSSYKVCILEFLY